MVRLLQALKQADANDGRRATVVVDLVPQYVKIDAEGREGYET
jgi:hypothetical protein